MSSVTGSTFGGSGGTTNVNWPTYSSSTLKGQLINNKTGAKKLSLPFVSGTSQPIEIIRRPPAGEDPSSSLGESRLYNMAQIRILFSDTAAQLPGGAQPGDVLLENKGAYANGVLGYDGKYTYFAEGHNDSATLPYTSSWVQAAVTEPMGTKVRWPLIGGVLRVERRLSNGAYENVTVEWLKHGFARRPQGDANYYTLFPDAILIFQMLADPNNSDSVTGDSGAINPAYPLTPTEFTDTQKRYNWFPLNMFDSREGIPRPAVENSTLATMPIGGIMNIVELNVYSLQRWLNGAMANSTGASTESTTQNGYLLYFSDRRGCISNGSGVITGEYGFEDVINNGNSYGYSNGILDLGEDVNGNNTLDTYGIEKLGDGFLTSAQGSKNAYDNPFTNRVNLSAARANQVTGPRHVLRLVTGGRGYLPRKSNGTGGFTVASENPVYVSGNYNADSSDFGSTEIAPYSNAAIIADAVTILSNTYHDLNTFSYPYAASSRTAGGSIYLRVSIAGGKNKLFKYSDITGSIFSDFGSDGGVHNFLRFIQSWSGQTVFYKGSLVSFNYSNYATGVYKYGVDDPVYQAPPRTFSFDSFLTQESGLPPGTPRFVDIANLGYFQDLSPGY